MELFGGIHNLQNKIRASVLSRPSRLSQLPLGGRPLTWEGCCLRDLGHVPGSLSRPG